MEAELSSSIPANLHPVMIVEDRYQGVYSGGHWWAIARGDEAFEGSSRLQWLMERGPGSDDVTAATFWGDPPPWIAAGMTMEEAVKRLLANPESGSDHWRPPPIEADPRYRRSLFL